MRRVSLPVTEYTLIYCIAFAKQRLPLELRLGSALTPASLERALIQSRNFWKTAVVFAKEVMSAKEAEKRFCQNVTEEGR